jgi:hypothetical protein
MKLVSCRISADAVVRPSIDKEKPEDPLGRHVDDHVICIPKRRPSTPKNTHSKPSEQHATKNGDVSSDTTADETSSTRKGLYSGGVRYFTVDNVRTRKDEVLKAKKSKSKERGEREVKQEEEEKKQKEKIPSLSSSCTDVAVIKVKRSKSVSTPDINRGRSVSRTRRQVDGIDDLQLPFTDKDDKIASSTLKGQQASFHNRFHDSDAVLKKGHNSSFRDSVGASLSRLRRSESNESLPSLLNSERRIRMMKEKSMMTTGGADERTIKIRGSGSYNIMECGHECSHSARRNVVPPPPPRTMFENKTSSPTSGGNVSDKKGDGWRNQSYQPQALSMMEYRAIPSYRSLSTDRGRNRITNKIPPRKDVSPNQIDFARHSAKDLKFDSAEEKEELRRNCSRFQDKKNEMRRNSRLQSAEAVQLVVDNKKAENSSRRNSILSSSSEPRTTPLSSVQYQGRDRNSQSQSRDRSRVRYKAPPTLPTRSLFQNKPMFGTWGGSGVNKVKEDWRNSRPPPSELKLLSRSKSSTSNLSSSMADMSSSLADISTSGRSSIVVPQRLARSRSINCLVGNSRRSSM